MREEEDVQKRHPEHDRSFPYLVDVFRTPPRREDGLFPCLLELAVEVERVRLVVRLVWRATES